MLCYEAWILIYNVFIYIFHDGYFPWHNQSLRLLGYEVILKTTPPMPHLWYMPMIITVYLAIPVVSYIKDKFEEKIFYLTFAALLAISFQSINATYLSYICLGYICYDLNVKSFNTRNLKILLIIAIGAISYVVAMQILDYDRGIVHNVWYTEKPLMYASAVLFPCFALLNKFRFVVIRELSKASFAIYLLHFPCMLLLVKPTHGLGFVRPITSIVLFLCTFLFAYGIFKMVSMNKTISRWIFLYK